MENIIKIKPLSVNEVWQGKRFKTTKYKDYEKELFYLLPKSTKIPKGKLKINFLFGVSSKNCDVDNPVKPFLDILQKRYNFNDKLIYQMRIKKMDVKKGQEFINFEIEKL